MRRREEALADVMTNEVLHFVSEAGMIEYLRLRHYQHVDSATALARTRQIQQGGTLAPEPSPVPAPVTPMMPAQIALGDDCDATPEQNALRFALAMAYE